MSHLTSSTPWTSYRSGPSICDPLYHLISHTPSPSIPSLCRRLHTRRRFPAARQSCPSYRGRARGRNSFRVAMKYTATNMQAHSVRASRTERLKRPGMEARCRRVVVDKPEINFDAGSPDELDGGTCTNNGSRQGHRRSISLLRASLRCRALMTAAPCLCSSAPTRRLSLRRFPLTDSGTRLHRKGAKQRLKDFAMGSCSSAAFSPESARSAKVRPKLHHHRNPEGWPGRRRSLNTYVEVGVHHSQQCATSYPGPSPVFSAILR